MGLDDSRFWFSALSEDLAYAVRLRTAAWLGTVLRASALVIAAAGIAAVVTRSRPVWWVYGPFALVVASALALDRAKRTRAAGVVLPLGFWAVATAAVFFLGGVRSPGSFVYLPIVVTAGLFWSWRAAALLTASSLGVEILVVWLHAIHRLPLPVQAPTDGPLLRIFAASLTMTAILVGVALHSLRGALQDVRRHALRTEELLLHVPDVLAVFDRLGVVLAVGPSMRDRAGYEPSELVGRHVSRAEPFGRKGRSLAEEFRALAARGADEVLELELKCKDGTSLWGEARMHALPHGKGDALRRIVLYDVTRRRAAEARQADLEKRVEQGRRFEAMGLLVGGVTHDFNNLLTVILSVGSVLDTQLPPDSMARELLRDINQSATRAAELARQLLAARPSEPPEVVDVVRELEALTPVLSRMMGEGMTLTMRSPTAPCFARVERASLERIATNLVANARDAMPNGGEVVVEVSRSLDADGARRTIELCVSDSGVGMDSWTRQRIFEPFYTTKGEGGTGLGLAAVDGIVARLGGSIRVDSRPGQGTKIRVFLPEAWPSEVSSSPPTACGTRRE
jgi:PAS domain S-box-containing protein